MLRKLNYRETVTSLNDFGRLLVCTAIHLGTAAGASLLVARTLNLRKEDYEASNDYEVNIMSITLLTGKKDANLQDGCLPASWRTAI